MLNKTKFSQQQQTQGSNVNIGQFLNKTAKQPMSDYRILEKNDSCQREKSYINKIKNLNKGKL